MAEQAARTSGLPADGGNGGALDAVLGQRLDRAFEKRIAPVRIHLGMGARAGAAGRRGRGGHVGLLSVVRGLARRRLRIKIC